MAITDFDTLDEAMTAIYAAQDAGDSTLAESLFRQAWADIPSPRGDYEVSQVLIGDFIDFLRDQGENTKAFEAVTWMREAYGAAEGQNPHVDFTAASIAYDLGDLDTARRLFGDLYAKFGKRPFTGSDDKYLAFVTAGK